MRWADGSDSASVGVAKRFLQQVEPAPEKRVVNRERHEDADHVAVDAAREQDQTAFARRSRDRLREVRARVGQLEGEHRAEPTCFPEQVALSHKVFETGPESLPDLI